MAKFKNDKERQEICIGIARVIIVKGTNKNGNTYYQLLLRDTDNDRLIHREFIAYDKLVYYLHLVSICDYDKYNKID